MSSSPTTVAPFGSGGVTTATVPPTVAVSRARYIDPRTRDYVYDGEGAYQRMPVTRQRILLALMTERDSSSVDPRGVKIPKRMGANWEADTRLEIKRVLEPIIKDGSMKLHAVLVKRTSLGRGEITIDYTDLTTGERDSVQI